MRDDLIKLMNKIDLLFANLEETGYFVEKTEEYKSFYEYLKSKYKDIINLDSSSLKFAEINLMSQYRASLQDDLLPGLKHLGSLSDILLDMKKLEQKEKIDLDEITKTLNTFIYLKDQHNNDECEKVKWKMTEFLYKMIEREIMELDTDNIIKVLNDLDNTKYHFVARIKMLYSKDMESLNKIVKNSNNDLLTKEDFIVLINAKGLEYKKRKKTLTRVNSESAYSDDTLDGNELDCLEFYQRTKVNPLPKNDEGNQTLRNYDLLNLNFYRHNSLKSKLMFRPFKNVNLSYTNAIVIPKFIVKKSPLSLENANLEGVDMRGVDLTDVNINGANLLNTGADINGAIGTCKSFSRYPNKKKIFVASAKITPESFQATTKQTPYPLDNHERLSEIRHNRILRLYDISCIDYSKIDYNLDKFHMGIDEVGHRIENYTLNLSYTNANINPQDYKNYNSPILINLEGVDMRNKNFVGVERIFSMANLKGTGAHLDHSFNPTVSEYIESK